MMWGNFSDINKLYENVNRELLTEEEQSKLDGFMEFLGYSAEELSSAECALK